ncbi:MULTISPECIES: DUF397 domain-containing protein [Streptacidiphilus]|uniref:DUF397 domain-containing protein n=1 Tax=Streptacidiphilus cavernicola TaxID=3342716 RepID=A0ABV6UW78_9ACTN|nr:DUF397 domain-containing protein [Streptacidiphilus jeojiense]
MEQPIDLTSLRWFKSSYSGDQGACVEIAHTSTGSVAVRDSKQNDRPGQQVFEFDGAAWQAFVNGARNGEFDLPVA